MEATLHTRISTGFTFTIIYLSIRQIYIASNSDKVWWLIRSYSIYLLPQISTVNMEKVLRVQDWWCGLVTFNQLNISQNTRVWLQTHRLRCSPLRSCNELSCFDKPVCSTTSNECCLIWAHSGEQRSRWWRVELSRLSKLIYLSTANECCLIRAHRGERKSGGSEGTLGYFGIKRADLSWASHTTNPALPEIFHAYSGIRGEGTYGKTGRTIQPWSRSSVIIDLLHKSFPEICGRTFDVHNLTVSTPILR